MLSMYFWKIILIKNTTYFWNVYFIYMYFYQTWSSRDLSLGLETRFYKSWSRSRSWNLRVLVLVSVLEPQSLGLGLGLGTLQSRSRSWDLRQWRLGLHHPWSVKLRQDRNHRLNCNANTVIYRSIWTLSYKVLHPLLEKVFCPPATLLLWNGYSATAVCWCGQRGLGWGDNMLSQLVYLRCNNKL